MGLMEPLDPERLNLGHILTKICQFLALFLCHLRLFCIHTHILILILSAYMILHQISAIETTANT